MALSTVDEAAPSVPSARESTGKSARMILHHVKSLAGWIGGVAVIAAVAISVSVGGSSSHAVAGGSGDSATYGFTAPSVPAMSVNPTAMSLGTTVTESPAGTTVAVASASPTFKATAAAGCVNTGQCP
jgi:hypothetical protein